MRKIYCLNCNKPSSYELSQPEKCPFCNKAYIESVNLTTKTVSIEALKAISNPILNQNYKNKQIGVNKGNFENNDADDSIENDAETIPKINNLNFLGGNEFRVNRQTAEDIITEGYLNKAKPVDKKKIKAEKKKIKPMTKKDKEKLKNDVKDLFRQTMATVKKEI